MINKEDIQGYLKVNGINLDDLSLDELKLLIKNKLYIYMTYEDIVSLSYTIRFTGNRKLMAWEITRDDMRGFQKEYGDRLAHYIVTEEDKDIIEFEFTRYDMFCNSVLDYLTLITYKELAFIYINDIDRVLDKYRTKLEEVNNKPNENFLKLVEKAKSEMRTNIELYD